MPMYVFSPELNTNTIVCNQIAKYGITIAGDDNATYVKYRILFFIRFMDIRMQVLKFT